MTGVTTFHTSVRTVEQTGTDAGAVAYAAVSAACLVQWKLPVRKHAQRGASWQGPVMPTAHGLLLLAVPAAAAAAAQQLLLLPYC
jgi:hypothetical protein